MTLTFQMPGKPLACPDRYQDWTARMIGKPDALWHPVVISLHTGFESSESANIPALILNRFLLLYQMYKGTVIKAENDDKNFGLKSALFGEVVTVFPNGTKNDNKNPFFADSRLAMLDKFLLENLGDALEEDAKSNETRYPPIRVSNDTFERARNQLLGSKLSLLELGIEAEALDELLKAFRDSGGKDHDKIDPFPDKKSKGRYFSQYTRLHIGYMQAKDLFSKGLLVQLRVANILFAGPGVQVIRDKVDGKKIIDVGFFEKAISNDGLAFTSGRKKDDSVHSDKAKVVLGVVDDGIGFLNDSLFDGKTSRLNAVWVQDIVQPKATDSVEFGHVYKSETYETKKGNTVHESETYRGRFEAQVQGQSHVISKPILDTSSSEHQPIAFAASHGTHVLETALTTFDTSGGKGLVGYAVQLPTQVTEDTSGSQLASYFLSAVWQLMMWADKSGNPLVGAPFYMPALPLVINFSYGFTAGPKDGLHPLEQILDLFIASRKEYGTFTDEEKAFSTIAVLPAGNNYRDHLTAVFDLERSESRTLDWVLLPDDHTSSFVEIWIDNVECSDAADKVKVTISPPGSGAITVDVSKMKSTTADLTDDDGNILATIYNDTAAGLKSISSPLKQPTWRRRLFIASRPTAAFEPDVAVAPSGHWSIALENAGKQTVKIAAHVQRDDTPSTYRKQGRQSFLDHPNADGWDTYEQAHNATAAPLSHKETINAIATGNQVLVVGSVFPDRRIDGEPTRSEYSSIGDTDAIPPWSAIADRSRARFGIYGAGTYSGTRRLLSGTSVAAPQIAGWIAMRYSKEKMELPAPMVLETIPSDRLRI